MRCPACGAALALVTVHGHGQCAACGQNVVPCCMGAGEESEADARGGLVTLDDLLAVVAEAGGTTPREALLNRFAQRTGCTWDDGAALLAAGIARGVLRCDDRGLVTAS